MYEDKTLVCKECGQEFVFTAGEQEFYAERGFQSPTGRPPTIAIYQPCSRILAKQSLQYTGRSLLGSKGTLASPPQFAQTAVKYSRGPRAAFLRASRQALQRWGSFWKPRSA